MKKVNISISEAQYLFVKRLNIKLSGLVQDIITMEMIRANVITDAEKEAFYQKMGISKPPPTFLEMAGNYEKMRDTRLGRKHD